MELYNQSKKQIFIAFDKEDAFYDVTRDIIHLTRLLNFMKMEENYLDDHGQRKQQEKNKLLQKLV